jgi:putative intracellular protease/amidase
MIAQPYFEFTHSGLDVVIASVKGGNVPMDPISLDRTHMTRATKKFTNDSKLMALLQNTLPISKYDVQDFDGIFVVGGHGAAYDMPKSIQVENMLQSFIATNKPIAAVAHGTAALVNLKAPDGSVFVEQRKFAAFTNEEEEELNLIEVMQYESALRATCVDKLISLGGNWLGMEPWVPYSIADRGLITGQNPASSERTAESLVDVICGPDPGPTSPEEGEL